MTNPSETAQIADGARPRPLLATLDDKHPRKGSSAKNTNSNVRELAFIAAFFRGLSADFRPLRGFEPF